MKTKQELTGTDASIEISLKEYGIAWKEQENDIIFHYGIHTSPDEYGSEEYDRFDNCFINKDTIIIKEYDWADFETVQSFVGLTQKEFTKQPLVQQIQTLLAYYGYENIFGSSYWAGRTFDEVIANDNN